MIDFSIDPVHFYLRRYGKDAKHTDDFNVINKLQLDGRKQSMRVYLWSDPLNDFVDVTTEFARINKKLGFTKGNNTCL